MAREQLPGRINAQLRLPDVWSLVGWWFSTQNFSTATTTGDCYSRTTRVLLPLIFVAICKQTTSASCQTVCRHSRWQQLSEFATKLSEFSSLFVCFLECPTKIAVFWCFLRTPHSTTQLLINLNRFFLCRQTRIPTMNSANPYK